MREKSLDSTNSKRTSTMSIKPGDLILVACFLCVALLAYIGISITSSTGHYVSVRVDGREVATYSLKEEINLALLEDGSIKENVSSSDQVWNRFVIKGRSLDMVEAVCPDHICLDHAPISRVGETIVCLPHKLVIEIVDEKRSSKDPDVIVK